MKITTNIDSVRQTLGFPPRTELGEGGLLLDFVNACLWSGSLDLAGDVLGTGTKSPLCQDPSPRRTLDSFHKTTNPDKSHPWLSCVS